MTIINKRRFLWVLFVSMIPMIAKSQPSAVVICDDVTDPATLDPRREFSEKNHTILQQIFEGLVRFDPNGQIEPALAISWERVDPLRMRFKLRPDVKFHNGEPFNADSVKFSISQFLDPSTNYPAIPFVGSIDRVEIVDDLTADILTKFPDGLLLNRLAAFAFMMPPQYVTDGAPGLLNSKPVGTGPFIFSEWVVGKQISLKANPNYWMSGFPKVKEIIFKFIPADAQVDAFLKGDIDILTELPGTATTRIRSTGFKVVKKESFYTLASNFNVAKGPLKDKRVRQALNYAIDREELVRYDLMGNGKALATFSMQGEEGFDPKIKAYSYDLAKARKLLAEAGYSQGFRLKGFVKHTGARAAGIIKAQWKRVNVDLDYQVKNETDFIGEIQKADLDVAFGGSPDPMAHIFFIQSMCYFSQSPYSIVKNPEYDKRLIEMISTLDDEKRIALARQLDNYVYDEALGIFTYQKIRTYAVKNRLSFTPYVTGMHYLFSLSD